MNQRYKNKVAVVTGAASGIGKAIAHKLGTEGATVHLLDLNQDALKQTKAEFQKSDFQVHTHTVDISDEEQVSGVLEAIINVSKYVHVMVHAAGIVGPTNMNISNYAIQDFDKLIAVNLRGSFLITKYCIKKMEQHGYGRILLIASIAGKEGNPNMIGYTTSKAGMIGMVKGVAKEYATKGIIINGLAPAVIKTAMNDNTTPEQLAYMTAKIPMQRLGTVDEVANLAAYAVSDDNSFTTGFIYDLSGGRATY
ncbi:MAG: SDR family NAD(P)-dependent oxidoreductase [Cytophagales bacterium]|nr:SDR family NAD(P)-dependent oxidoreductase [Cytophagales bacterium]